LFLSGFVLFTPSGDSTEAVGFVSITQTGPSVDAFWHFDNPDGTFTDLSVIAGKTRRVVGEPPPQTFNEVFVDIATIDLGDPNDPFDDSGRFISGFAELEPGQLQIDLADPSATLDLTLTGTECAFTPAGPSECEETSIEVSLAWVATGETLRDKAKTHDNLESCRVRAHGKFKGTPAEASGSIMTGNTNHTRGEPSNQFATITEKARDQIVFIAKSFEDCFGEPEPMPEAGKAK
jgi:hypothetical protein